MPEDLSPQEMMELAKKNCIFCKIIAGEIPSKKVFEDDKTLVVLDINPANDGHCLVLPKEHYQIMPQIPNETLSHLFVISKKISHTILKALGAEGTTILAANGAVAGQKAPHFMIHVIPRKPGDKLFPIPKIPANPDELDSIHAKILEKLGVKPKPKPLPAPEPKPEDPEEKVVEAETVPDEEEERPKPEPTPKKGDIDIDSIAGLFT